MSTTQIFQVVGTVIGTYLGGPWGGAIGSAIGTYVGYQFEPDTEQRGPRLDDRRVQISTYGAAIPYLFGTVRVAGNVIWSEDIEEVTTENEQDSKGGGPTNTTITYSYFGTFAVLLGYGPLRGVRRIWADAVLIFDGTVEPALGDVSYTFYGGSEDQLPDPTIEAALGVGNVPAYRGFGYIVFHRLPLEKFGNRLPSITVECVADGTWQSVGTKLGPDPTLIGLSGSVYFGSLIMGAAQASNGDVIYMTYPNTTGVSPTAGIKLTRIDRYTGEPLLSITHPGVTGSNEVIDRNYMCYVPPLDEVWVSGTGATIYRFNASTLGEVSAFTLAGGVPRLAWEPHRRAVYFRPNAAWICAGGSTVVLGAGTFNVDVLRLNGPVTSDAGTIELFEGPKIHYETMDAIITGLPLSFLIDGSAQSALACFDPTRGRYIVIMGRIWTVTDADPPTMEVRDYPAGASVYSLGSVTYDSGTDSIIILSGVVGIVQATILNAGTFELLYQGAVTGDGTLGITNAFPQAGGSLLALGSYQPWEFDYFGATVGAAVRRLSVESGLTSGDVDVSELGMRLRGYIVAQAGPAVSAVEQLARVFLFEGVEEDDQLYFRRRGGATVATITEDECAAGIDKATDEAIVMTRTQEIELPKRFAVTAPDPSTDHQPGTQYGERRAIQAGEEESLSTAVVLTATENKRTADALIFDRWASRDRLSWATHCRYVALSPTDPIVLDGRRVRVLRRTQDGGVLKFEGVADDADVVTQTSSGVQGAFPGQVPSIQVPTVMQVMDVPLLADAQNHSGAYVAAWGLAPYWHGAVIYDSTDGGTGWTRLATMPRPGSAMGYTTDALGGWTGGNVFDEANSVNVSIQNGTLASTTRAGVLAGNNPIAINGANGWEILQYREATLEGDGTYTLRGLLRGRRGTEYAMSGHAAGDRAVPLTTTNLRDMAISTSFLGVSLPFKAVSVGDTISGTPSGSATINAERLKPFAPVDLRALRDVATGDITMTWRRRTRLAYRFLAEGINAPLGEDSEAYTVKVYDSTYTTLKRTIAVSGSATCTYTSAQQTTDFGANQTTVYVRITQTGAVGAGHILEAAA